MAEKAVKEKDVSIALACRTFEISEACYRYQAKLSDENAEIANWLLRLTLRDGFFVQQQVFHP
jgi:putative transposase